MALRDMSYPPGAVRGGAGTARGGTGTVRVGAGAVPPVAAGTVHGDAGGVRVVGMRSFGKHFPRLGWAGKPGQAGWQIGSRSGDAVTEAGPAATRRRLAATQRGPAGTQRGPAGTQRGSAATVGASRVTLQDVADRAEVSLTTASRVVSAGARRVGQQLIDRVNLAVAELGYTANLQARAVATGQSNTIGVVVHDIADPYFSSIAAGLIEVAYSRQMLVCLSSTPAGELREREYVALMRAQRARAVVLIGSRSDDVTERRGLRGEIDAFRRSGGRVAQGHRSFAVLAGPRELLTARDRLAGFKAGLRSWSVRLEPRDVIYGEFTRDSGYEAMSTVLARGSRLPDCVFA